LIENSRGSDHRNPRVAIVYPIPFGEDGLYGGGERYALELARAMAEKTPTRLVTFGAHPRKENKGNLEIRIFRPRRYIHGQRINPLSFGFLRALKDVDVIHCVCWNTLVTDLSIIYGRLAGKKVFVTDVGGGGSLSLNRRLRLGRFVNGFLLIAEQGGGQFKEFRSKWRIIYAGIDTDHYKPNGILNREGVVFVGRLLPHKGVNYLIEAMDGDAPLTVVGHPYQKEYYELLQQLSAGKKVTFLTDASDEEVIRRYQSSAVMVFPSVYDTIYGDHTDLPELLGFTAMEAMACGTPVVCSDVGAMSEVVVDGETGFLVPPNNPNAIKNRLEVLLRDKSLTDKLGKAARARILEHFTWDRVAQRCLKAYLE
jgi:glycosyltransferase involved in cell wall biosynthesis